MTNGDSVPPLGDGGADVHSNNNKGDNAAIANIALDLRQRGNFEFSNGRCDEAIAFYTAALEHCSNDAITNNPSRTTSALLREERILNLCNRSACYSQKEDWEFGIDDALEAWNLSNESSVKAAYRLAKCSLQLKDYETAKAYIQAGLRVLDDQEIQIASQQPVPCTLSDSTRATSEDIPTIQQPVPSPTTTTTTATTTTTTTTTVSPDTSKQRSALQDLWKQTLSMALTHSTSATEKIETSIKFVKRPISIKEFQLSKSLGHGNFSEIIMVSHKVTNEMFALKKIEKKQAAELYKRQHPNVYNEIQMERRVLLERLGQPGHPYIVRMYHAFQDYNSLYYLMDIHVARTDLWSQLRYKNLPGYGTTTVSPGEKLVMMGCHRSVACLWLYELIDALEYIHRHGIVHRDLKTENILLSATGHVVVIDFGTAKDLIQTDLNGPEFVGTPDFMSPEAVTGSDQSGKSSISQYSLLSDKEAETIVEAGPEADLWALGAIAFILQTGHTPYWSPSPYLAFLKIKRSLQYDNLLRPAGIIDDNCWDLITKLMKGDPTKRIGAGSFRVDKSIIGRKMCCRPDGYDAIREHPYFATVHNEVQNNQSIKCKSVPIPSLLDLCYRACAEMAYRDSKNYVLCDVHPPGDGSKHDLMRLEPRDRAAAMHCLDRRRLLSEPRLYARFFTDAISARLDKIRVHSRDVVGLTQMNDDQGKPPKAQMHDQYATPIETDPISIVHITSPYFYPDSVNVDEITRKAWIKQLKKCIISINRNRPNLVVVTGNLDDTARKIISKISETIPTVIHDGTSYFTFWRMGIQCIALSIDQLQYEAQLLWLRQQLEPVRLSKYPLFVFVSTDPNELSSYILKKLTQGRTLCIFGLSKWDASQSSATTINESTISYEANESIDDTSIRSTDSEEDDKDNFCTKLISTSTTGLHWISVDDEPDKWTTRFETIEV
jgi:serine/threonine protein kinase